jgi:hypothetical protein
MEGSVLLQTAIGSALLIFTVLIHCLFTIAAVSMFGSRRILHRHRERFVALAALVLMMFFASLIEASAWAVIYVVVDAIPNLEKALYFSTVTFTTLGYGDITLNEDWRLLAAFQAANGTIMFGWTTALVVALVHTFFNQR